uniref:cytochrome c oxidase subunit 5A, mitochondrial isoform X2 n=1 Tax=Myxine glutinosa TaxID=7769 RepID=UPI00358F7CD1
MFRLLANRVTSQFGRRAVEQRSAVVALPSLLSRGLHKSQETDEEFDAHWVMYFDNADITAWDLRKGLNTLYDFDLVPEPKILSAAFKACRRLNDLASTVRLLEAVKNKAGGHKDIYPYIIQELQPTMQELGISTPEELGLDKV